MLFAIFPSNPFVERFVDDKCASARDCHVARLTVIHVLRVSDW